MLSIFECSMVRKYAALTHMLPLHLEASTATVITHFVLGDVMLCRTAIVILFRCFACVLCSRS